MASNSPSKPFYIKLPAVLVSLIALVYIAVLGKAILTPLLFSFLFSMLLLPLANFLEKKVHVPRSAASAVSVILLVLLLICILYLIGSQLSNLADDWPQFKQQVMTALNDLQHWISTTFHVRIKQQMTYVNDATSHILSSGTSVIGTAVLSLSSVLLFLVFTLIDTFFLLYYRRLIIRFLVAVFREENSITVYDILARIQSSVRNYILGLMLEMVIVSTATCLALWLLGVKYAILLGLLTGLFNIVPYIGIFTALTLSTLITFATAAGTGKILLVIVSILGIHLLDSNILFPMIMGKRLRINALITILGVIVGESIWGIAGMFFAIPVIAITKIVFDRIDSLKPWGMLLGDERDEKEPIPLKQEIKEEGPLKPEDASQDG
jgi:putative permease